MAGRQLSRPCPETRALRATKLLAPATSIREGNFLSQVSRALDLLGQATKPAAPVRLERGVGPKLDVAWGSFHQGIGSSLRAVLTWTRVPKNFLHVGSGFFKECWVDRRVP